MKSSELNFDITRMAMAPLSEAKEFNDENSKFEDGLFGYEKTLNGFMIDCRVPGSDDGHGEEFGLWDASISLGEGVTISGHQGSSGFGAAIEARFNASGEMFAFRKVSGEFLEGTSEEDYKGLQLMDVFIEPRSQATRFKIVSTFYNLLKNNRKRKTK